MSDVKTAGVRKPSRERRKHEHHESKQGPSFLKFSGTVLVGQSFLADTGSGDASDVPHAYPTPVAFDTNSMAATLFGAVPIGGSLTIQCVRNGVEVPGFSITYGEGETGTKSVSQRVPFAQGDTIGLVVISTLSLLVSLLLDTIRQK
jgi:hypothetical protein